MTANKAVLNYAARHREELLYNIWLMGKRAIDRGNRDSWTVTPKMAAAARGAWTPAEYQKFFRDPAKRDARGYILPADQPDFLTATKFVNTLIGTGVKVHRAKAGFETGGKKYPAGSYVVKCAQAFRAHVLDMFEPQDHPDDFVAPGVPLAPPYDAAGYTFAFQMGVQFDRVLERFDGPFEELKDEVPPPPARVTGAEKVVGFFLDTRTNDAFRAANQLLAAGEEVRRLKEPFTTDGVTHPAGTFFVTTKDGTPTRLEKIAAAARHGVRRWHPGTGQGSGATQAGTGGPVGPLRRVDGVGLDPLALRAVRVSVRGRLPARTGQGRLAREVRRDRPRGRGHRPGRGARGPPRPRRSGWWTNSACRRTTAGGAPGASRPPRRSRT